MDEARLDQLRRAGGADRDHADGAGGTETLDQPGTVSACAELLHVAAGTGGDAACDLCRLAAAQNARRDRRRGALRAPVGLHSLGAELCLSRVWPCALDRGGFLRLEAGRDRDRARSRGADRAQGVARCGALGNRGARIRGDLFSRRPLPRDRARRGRGGIVRRAALAGKISRREWSWRGRRAVGVER